MQTGHISHSEITVLKSIPRIIQKAYQIYKIGQPPKYVNTQIKNGLLICEVYYKGASSVHNSIVQKADLFGPWLPKLLFREIQISCLCMQCCLKVLSATWCLASHILLIPQST